LLHYSSGAPGQNIVFLLLISNGVTLPVGFKLYEPDPTIKVRKEECKRLKAKGVSKKYYPQPVKRSSDYPTQVELALELIEEFTNDHKEINIIAIIADTLYGTKYFIEKASLFGAQVITEIKSTQHIKVNNKFVVISEFFKQYNGLQESITLSYNNQLVQYVTAKFTVKALQKKCLVIALKYEGEESYRYLIASNLSWQPIDVIKAYANRWLIEVFIQDWKSYEGWESMAKQPGIDGSIRGITLSLLCDHALLTHDEKNSLV
jgi:hypothetical protein